uniref:BRCT domain-containing protein n=1 Tax=Bicosoecida sp. CB-2014 TaxID=1486930 RepID=A0A7S1CNL7_9STRA
MPPVAEHKLQPLAGLEICLTGFTDPDERERVEADVVSGGAELGRALKKATTTHLVAAEAAGHKFDAAVRWGVPVLTRRWLADSLKRGVAIPVAADDTKYSLAPPRTPAASAVSGSAASVASSKSAAATTATGTRRASR